MTDGDRRGEASGAGDRTGQSEHAAYPSLPGGARSLASRLVWPNRLPESLDAFTASVCLGDVVAGGGTRCVEAPGSIAAARCHRDAPQGQEVGFGRNGDVAAYRGSVARSATGRVTIL